MTQPRPYRYWLKIFENRLEIWDSQAQEVYATFSRQTATIVGAMTYMQDLNREDILKQDQLRDQLILRQIERMGLSTIEWAWAKSEEPIYLTNVPARYREDWERWHRDNQEFFALRMEQEIQKELQYDQ